MTDLPEFRRDVLFKAFNGDQRLVSAFEQLVAYVIDAADDARSGAGASAVLGSAPLLVLAADEALAGARVLSAGEGVAFADAGGLLTVSLDDLTPKINGGFPATFIVTGATNLILPALGTLATLADVAGAVGASVISFNTRTGAVTLTRADVAAVLNEIVTAGQALGGHRAVYVAADGKAYYGNPDATCRVVIGITTGAVSLGADATVQTSGEIDEPSWTWADTGPVWLAASGQLTQTLPATGYLFQVGTPMGPTRLRIEPQLVAQLP